MSAARSVSCTVVVATSTVGTKLSDLMDRTLGFGYAIGSAILGATLDAILTLWRWRPGSLAVDHVRDRRIHGRHADQNAGNGRSRLCDGRRAGGAVSDPDRRGPPRCPGAAAR